MLNWKLILISLALLLFAGCSNGTYTFDSAVTIIDTPHNEIHKGNHYYITDSVILNLGQTRELLINTGNVSPHFIFILRSTTETNLSIIENVVASNNGTAFTEFNRNRNSPNNATTQIYLSPSYTNGTQIYKEHTGATRFSGAEIRSNNELILKLNTSYVIKITSEVNNDDVSIILDWYE